MKKANKKLFSQLKKLHRKHGDVITDEIQLHSVYYSNRLSGNKLTIKETREAIEIFK